MNRTMAFAIAGSLIITVHGPQPPSNEEWVEYVRALVKLAADVKDHSTIRNIVFTEGGAPNSGQRKAVNDIGYSKSVTSAIISKSQFVRTVVTAFSWFNDKVKAFSPETMEDAYKHLRLTKYEIEVVSGRLKQLRAQLEASAPVARNA